MPRYRWPVQFSMTIPASPRECAALIDSLISWNPLPVASTVSTVPGRGLWHPSRQGGVCVSRLRSVPGSIIPCRSDAMKNAPGSGVQIFACFEWFLIWFSSLAT